jgi:hypothetical protein
MYNLMQRDTVSDFLKINGPPKLIRNMTFGTPELEPSDCHGALQTAVSSIAILISLLTVFSARLQQDRIDFNKM